MTIDDTATRAAMPDPGAIEAFRRRLNGPLLRPLDAGFAESTRLWNGMIDKTPAIAVAATGTADIVTAIEFARTHDLPLSVRGGGHNIAGSALVDGGLTIDMSGLRGIHVDPVVARTATVQAGCTRSGRTSTAG
jgi:FAD/FMN-containing dehydrogenase